MGTDVNPAKAAYGPVAKTSTKHEVAVKDIRHIAGDAIMRRENLTKALKHLEAKGWIVIDLEHLHDWLSDRKGTDLLLDAVLRYLQERLQAKDDPATRTKHERNLVEMAAIHSQLADKVLQLDKGAHGRGLSSFVVSFHNLTIARGSRKAVDLMTLHSDFSLKGCVDQLLSNLGYKAVQSALYDRTTHQWHNFSVINVWQPLQASTIRPLAVLDLDAHDYENRLIENTEVYLKAPVDNKKDTAWFVSNQTRSEPYIFFTFDTRLRYRRETGDADDIYRATIHGPLEFESEIGDDVRFSVDTRHVFKHADYMDTETAAHFHAMLNGQHNMGVGLP